MLQQEHFSSGSKNSTLRKIKNKYLESFKNWLLRGTGKIERTEKIADEDVLRNINHDFCLCRKADKIDTSLVYY